MDPAIVFFGLGVGLLVGMTGMGGGSLMTPLLVLLFNVHPVTAVATDNLYGGITKSFGSWRHLREGTVHRGIAFWLAVGSVPSAIAGVWFIEILQNSYGEDRLNQLVLGILAAALLVVGVAVFLRALFLADVIPERSAMHLYRPHILMAIGTGVLTGFLIGLTSAGSGTLIAIVLIAVFRLTPQRVVGTDIFHAAVLQWAAGIAHWVGGNVDFALMGNILIGSIPGVLVGAHFGVRAPQKFIRYALATVLLLSGIALIVKEGTASVVIPSLAVAAVVVGGLFGAQIMLRRQAAARSRASA